MLARALRISLIVHLVAAVTLFYWLLPGGALRALLLTFFVMAVAEFGPMALACALSRMFASPPLPAQCVGFLGGLGAFLEELRAFFLLARLYMPFDGFWLGPDAPLAPGGKPVVLLVHGYICNRGFWVWQRRRLLAAGYRVATITLDPPFADIERLAESLAARIDELARESGGQPILLVGHSMGGLVSRAYLRRYGAARVAHLVTLGSPHHGTRLAGFGLGRNARQMEVGNAWLAELNAAPLPVPATAVWSAHDTIVAPQDSARLPGAREIAVGGIGHLAMAFSPVVLAALRGELASEENT